MRDVWANYDVWKTTPPDWDKDGDACAYCGDPLPDDLEGYCSQQCRRDAEQGVELVE